MAFGPTPANTYVPISVPTDANYNPSLVEFMDRRLQMVDQNQRPVTSRIPRRNVSGSGQPHIQWTEYSRRAVETEPAPYGARSAPSAPKRPERRATVLQSMLLSDDVSFEDEASGKYGIESEIALRRMEMGTNLQISIERILCNLNQSSQLATTANDNKAQSPTFESMIYRNAKVGGGGAGVGGWKTASGSYVSRTRALDGSGQTKDGIAQGNTDHRVALTGSDIVDLHNQIGSKYSVPTTQGTLFMGLHLKTAAAEFAKERGTGGGVGVAQQRQTVRQDGAAVITTLEIFRTDAGTLMLVWNPQMDASVKGGDENPNAFLITPSMWEICGFYFNRPINFGRRGTSYEFGMTSSFGLKGRAEASSGALYDRKAA